MITAAARKALLRGQKEAVKEPEKEPVKKPVKKPVKVKK